MHELGSFKASFAKDGHLDSWTSLSFTITLIEGLKLEMDNVVKKIRYGGLLLFRLHSMSMPLEVSSSFGALQTLAVDRLLDGDLHLGQDSGQPLTVPVEAAGQDDRPLAVAALAAALTVLHQPESELVGGEGES